MVPSYRISVFSGDIRHKRNGPEFVYHLYPQMASPRRNQHRRLSTCPFLVRQILVRLLYVSLDWMISDWREAESSFGNLVAGFVELDVAVAGVCDSAPSTPMPLPRDSPAGQMPMSVVVEMTLRHSYRICRLFEDATPDVTRM